MNPFLLASLWALVSGGANLVVDRESTCKKYDLSQTLHVYKDPDVFLPDLRAGIETGKINLEALRGESFLLTPVKGEVFFRRVGPEQEFKNFREILRVFELANPSARIKKQPTTPVDKKRPLFVVPIVFCGQNSPYTDTIGFVLVDELREALKPSPTDAKGSMPPSTPANPVPPWRG